MSEFALVEPTGKYFVNPSYTKWSFTPNESEATKFNTLAEANEMKEIIQRAIGGTYWDYDDIIPFPKIKEIES